MFFRKLFPLLVIYFLSLLLYSFDWLLFPLLVVPSSFLLLPTLVLPFLFLVLTICRLSVRLWRKGGPSLAQRYLQLVWAVPSFFPLFHLARFPLLSLAVLRDREIERCGLEREAEEEERERGYIYIYVYM